MIQKTLSIVKPDGVKKNVIGEVISRFEKNGLKVVALRMKHLTAKEAEGFYAVHKARPFFGSLVKFMSSGPVVLMALEGESAVEQVRALMGATDPAKAAPGTLRKDFAANIEENIVHGSDAPQTAKLELAYFFPGLEINEICGG